MAKIALVTGGNKGIGFEICRQLGERGFHVILGARSPERGEAAVAALEERGFAAEFLELDMASQASVDRAAETVQSRHGRLDALVNNAGVFLDKGAALDGDADAIAQTFTINALGPFLLIQRLWPLMTGAKPGRIVNMSSGMGGLTEMGGGYPGYRVSKAALNAFTRMLSGELAEKGVVINTMCPGWVRTDMGGDNATRSTAEGADTAVWLIAEAPADLTGKFLRDRREIAW